MVSVKKFVLKNVKKTVRTLLAVFLLFLGQFGPVLAGASVSSGSPETKQDVIMILKRSTNQQDRKQFMNSLQNQGLQPEMLRKLNAIFVQIPNSELKQWQSHEKVAAISCNKPVELQEVLFLGEDGKPVEAKSASNVREGLTKIHALAKTKKKEGQTATLGLVSEEPVGETTHGIFMYALAELSEYGVSSTFLAGKPLSGVDVHEQMAETNLNPNRQSYKAFYRMAQNHEHWYDLSESGKGDFLFRLMATGPITGDGGYLLSRAYPNETLGLAWLIRRAVAAVHLTVAGGANLLNYLATGALRLMFQDAISPPWNGEGQEAELELDSEKLQNRGITLAMIGESRGIYPDGPGGRDDQHWWNPADWFDGKTGAYTVVSDAYIQHSYRMIKLVKQILDQRRDQYNRLK